jgi:FemAB-related protein (PEP-CTERM system-associated)
MQVEVCQERAPWDAYVEAAPCASNYHRWGWKEVIEKAFGWPTFYLVAKEATEIKGVLPLVWQKSWLFGSFVTSLPFFSHAGVLAESRETEELLVGEAIVLARKLGAGYLELRHRCDHGLGLPTKTSKVSVLVTVEPDRDKMMKSLRSEVRTKIRKAVKCGLTSEMLGEEALSDFYAIFAERMRDLGTPVYTKSFFGEIFQALGADTHICVVKCQGKPVAATFLVVFRETIESLWSCSRRRFTAMEPTALLNWTILLFAAERGYHIFDFGRSTVGSGPHRYKLQWGSREVPLHWDYWSPQSNNKPELSRANPKYDVFIKLWQRLPLRLTKLLGPSIVRCLPY